RVFLLSSCLTTESGTDAWAVSQLLPGRSRDCCPGGLETAARAVSRLLSGRSRNCCPGRTLATAAGFSCSMVGMRSTSCLAVAAVTVGATLFTAAGATATQLGGTVELGATKSPVVAPVCPPGVSSSKCTIILTRVTALETIRDGTVYPTKVSQPGTITAFTVGLSQLSSSKSTQNSYIHYLDGAYGGTARVALTVLAPGGGKKTQWRWKVVAQSPIYHVQPYLGSVVRIPLDRSLPVARGNVVALTTPTWAPILSINLDAKKYAYRQSRQWNCNSPPASNQAQLTLGRIVGYGCDYPGTRLEYSATEDLYPLGTKPVSG
ncbi:MAG: hypothetical protein ACM3UX_01180, partial [Candidatus Woesearchaeota archaeon]